MLPSNASFSWGAGPQAYKPSTGALITRMAPELLAGLLLPRDEGEGDVLLLLVDRRLSLSLDAHPPRTASVELDPRLVGAIEPLPGGSASANGTTLTAHLEAGEGVLVRLWPAAGAELRAAVRGLRRWQNGVDPEGGGALDDAEGAEPRPGLGGVRSN
eukprot:5360142-Prymnesium_polylepis.1